MKSAPPRGEAARRTRTWRRPNLVHLLNYPTNHEAWFDIVMNELDGEWYEERNPVNLAKTIDIPVYLQIDQGRGWTVDGHIELFEQLRGPKRLEIGSYPPMQSRPWVEEHDTMFRWYDYWLKGIDNGIMDEPAVSVFVEGTREVVTADQWPPKDLAYRPVYLRPRRKLSFSPELMGAEHAAPDGFYQAPLTVTDKVELLDWSTPPFEEPTEMIGAGAAHLFVEIDQPDTNLIVRLWDAAPTGKRQVVTTGFLKASHRELDERTTDGNPYHPHTRAVPVEPGVVEEYVVRLYPFAATFLPGHRLVMRALQRRATGRRAQRASAARRLPPAGGRPVPTRSTATRRISRDWCCPSPRPRSQAETTCQLSDLCVTPTCSTRCGRRSGATAGPSPACVLTTWRRWSCAVVERAPHLDPASVDEVVLGNANGAGEDNRNVARMAVLLGGLRRRSPRPQSIGCAVRASTP